MYKKKTANFCVGILLITIAFGLFQGREHLKNRYREITDTNRKEENFVLKFGDLNNSKKALKNILDNNANLEISREGNDKN